MSVVRLNQFDIIIASLYRSAKQDVASFLRQLHSELIRLTAISPRIILVGDFNLNAKDSSSKAMHDLETMMIDLEFVQHLHGPTTIHNTTIDRVYSKNVAQNVCINRVETFFSVHYGFIISLAD